MAAASPASAPKQRPRDRIREMAIARAAGRSIDRRPAEPFEKSIEGLDLALANADTRPAPRLDYAKKHHR